MTNISENLETDIVRPSEEKDRRRRSNESMEVSGHQMMGRPKLRY